MATTSDGIWTPDQLDDYNLVADLATSASTVQSALNKRANAYRGTTSERTSFTNSAPEGTIWADTNGGKFLWIKRGNVWDRVDAVPNPNDPYISNWLTTPLASGFTGVARWRRIGMEYEMRFDISGTVTGDTLVVARPAGTSLTPEGTGISPATAYIDPATARATSVVYFGDSGLRATAGGSANPMTRMRGMVLWRAV